MQNGGDEPGGDSCADWTAGGETGARRDIPSIVVDLEGFRDPSLGRLAQSWGAQTQQ
jgi:hypothetical protein